MVNLKVLLCFLVSLFSVNAFAAVDEASELRRLVSLSDGVSSLSFSDKGKSLSVMGGLTIVSHGRNAKTRYKVLKVLSSGKELLFEERGVGVSFIHVPPFVGREFSIQVFFEIQRGESGRFVKIGDADVSFSFDASGSVRDVSGRDVLADSRSPYAVNLGKVGEGVGVRGFRVVELYNQDRSVAYSVSGISFSGDVSRLLRYDFSKSAGSLVLPVSVLSSGYEGDADLYARVLDVGSWFEQKTKSVRSSLYASYSSDAKGGDWVDVLANRHLEVSGGKFVLDVDLGREVLNFSGSGYVDLMPLQDVFVSGQDFSYSLLVNISKDARGPMSIVSLGDNDGVSSQSLMLGGDTVDRLEVSVSSRPLVSLLPTIIGTGWHRVTVVNEGGLLSLYVGELLAGSWSVSSERLDGFFNFIGRSHSSVKGKYFNGSIGDFLVWKRALAPDEVRALAFGG